MRENYLLKRDTRKDRSDEEEDGRSYRTTLTKREDGGN
jgi:hypothetical protein